MKKTLLIIGISAALFSCKKQTTKEFEATDLTGNSTLKGNLSKKVIVAGGALVNEPASGIEVSVRIANSALYPNNTNAQGAKNYYGTSDAMGNYVVIALSNQSGAAATITAPDMVSTLDTIINGTRRTGLPTQFVGATTTKTLVAGTETNWSFTYGNNAVGGNPNNIYIGDAWVTGWVTYQTVKAFTSASGTLTPSGTTYSVAAGNTPVWLTYVNDPTTGTARTYSVNTDVAGKYTFTITASASTAGTANLKLPDYIHTMDTTVFTNASYTTISTPAKTGKAGFYGDFSPIPQTGILAKEFRYVNMNYSGFTQF